MLRFDHALLVRRNRAEIRRAAKAYRKILEKGLDPVVELVHDADMSCCEEESWIETLKHLSGSSSK